jgi:hypothetical protein
MKNMIKALLLLFGALTSAMAALNPDTAAITVVASGETHAMLYPCDCPDNPGGGLAERAAAIRKTGDTPSLLLLDAGGFAGGGIYDDYTAGRAADSQRTITTVRAMGMMRYDAAAIGDDDLQYGGKWLAAVAAAAGLPLVSANCFFPGGKAVAPLYRIVVKKGVRFAITAIAAPERLFPRDDSVVVKPPVESLKKIWKEMTNASDFRIILSHLGEEATAKLADSFPACDLIVNGHRKVSPLPILTRGKTGIMQFGYQGKKLAFAKIRCVKVSPSLSVEASGWVDVGPAAGADSAVAAYLASAKGGEIKPVYDLYIMSLCSYGCAALREFVDIVKMHPAIEWNVWFIGSLAGDSLSSLHGREEADDEMSWLAVKSLYPDKWLAFLAARSAEGATTRSAVAALRLDSVRIAAWVKKQGRPTLADHYRRSMRLAVTASPTLFVNNTIFEKAIESRRLAKAWCAFTKGSSAAKMSCDSLPECFDDADCRKKGMVGACLPAGRCGFTPDAPFTFTALVADSTLQHPEKTVIATTEELFPNAAIQTVTMNSPAGRSMMQAYAPLSLPYYLFGGGVAHAHNYSRVESGLVRVKDGFTFKNGIAAKNYFPRREKSPQSAALLVDPLFPDAALAIGAVLADSLLKRTVRIFPVIYADPNEAALSVEEKLRREEALRWLVFDAAYRDAFAAYLARWSRDPGSSYWFVNLGPSGINVDVFVKQITAQAALLSGHWRLLDELGNKEPISLLLENRQLIVVKNETELNAVLTAIRPQIGK